MGRRDELVVTCAGEIQVRCGMQPEMDLLDRVIKACGPAAFSATGATVDPADAQARDHIRTHFLIRKLGLKDGPELAMAIDNAFEVYASQGAPHHRAVIYYLLVKYFGRDAAL